MTTTAHTASAHPTVSDSIARIALSLTMFALFCGLIIAVINHFTSPIRIANEEAMRREAQRSVAPAGADTFEPIAGFAQQKAWYRGKDKTGNTVGYVLPVKTRGYDGFIDIMLGIDTAGKIVDFVLLNDKETPGLGALAREKPFRSKFVGRTADRLEVTNKPDGDKIVGITGATITSRAVAKGLRETLTMFQELNANGFSKIPPELAHAEEGHE
jgi:electron transport complex protein RnfG